MGLQYSKVVGRGEADGGGGSQERRSRSGVAENVWQMEKGMGRGDG
jgi:hypothetical protein